MRGCFTAILYRIPGEPMDVPMLWDGYTMAQRGEPAKALGWALVAALIGGSGVLRGDGGAGGADERGRAQIRFAGLFRRGVLRLDHGGRAGRKIAGEFADQPVRRPSGGDHRHRQHLWHRALHLRRADPARRRATGRGSGRHVRSRRGAGADRRGACVSTAQGRPQGERRDAVPVACANCWRSRSHLLRSTILGTVLGIVPGAGATITSFISYGIEKQYGRRRQLLGTGIPEGIVAPQIGATASVAGHMIPLLTLGLPGSGATAVILAAFLLHGVQPGPMLFENPASSLMVYTILASMFASVIGMCVVGFFWIRVVVKVLTIPQGVLSAIVVMFCLVGSYANRNDMSDVWMIVIFGVLGYLFEKFRYPISPMVLGAILGPVGETRFMRSMISSDSDWTVFFKGPICGPLMVARCWR